MFKKLIWRVRYTLEFNNITKFGFSYCFEVSGSSLENISGDLTECPKYCAEQDSVHWYDDEGEG
jgi:hypothetical protein